MSENYNDLDKNVVVETKINEPDIQFFDVRRDPFDVYGFYDYKNQPIFRRLPEDVADSVSPYVAKLCRESSGGRVRFSTDSSYVAIKAVMPVIGRGSHTTLVSSAGFDLYEDTMSDSRFIRPFLPPYGFNDGYEQIQRFGSRKMRSFTINFPVHSVVEKLYIGIQNDAKLEHGRKYLNSKPVIVYGSSIVHGTAATRPGLTYPNILSRRLDMDFTNLGFSGHAKGETAMAEYIAGLPMSIFIFDYDHNAPNVEHLAATHRPFYDIVREKNPELPIILMTRPNVATNGKDAYERRDVVIDTFRYAREKGDKKVYYIDGETFFQGKYENDCTVDGVHPNDLGFSLMADSIERVIVHILRDLDI